MADSKTSTDKAKQWGAEAEQIAADYLLTSGYTIRERNWRPKNSKLEVDIIAQIGSTIVFVEVKARTSGFSDGAEAVDIKKQRNLTRAAAIYLSSVTEDFEYRFDIITLLPRAVYDREQAADNGDFARLFAPKGLEPTLIDEQVVLDHLPDAFLPPLSTR